MSLINTNRLYPVFIYTIQSIEALIMEERRAYAANPGGEAFISAQGRIHLLFVFMLGRTADTGRKKAKEKPRAYLGLRRARIYMPAAQMSSAQHERRSPNGCDAPAFPHAVACRAGRVRSQSDRYLKGWLSSSSSKSHWTLTPSARARIGISKSCTRRC